MNELLKEKATESLIDIIDGVAAVKDFAIEQAPGVIQQLLAWRFAISLIGFIAFCIMITSGVFSLVLFAKWIKEDNGDCNGRTLSTLILGIILPLLSPIVWSVTWLQIAIAPKLFLIEYAAGLIK